MALGSFDPPPSDALQFTSASLAAPPALSLLGVNPINSVPSNSVSPQAIRRRLLRMHYEAGVGHIGGNLSCLDAILVAHHSILKAQDQFVLSKGHSAGALYVTLWSCGVLSDSDLATFHQDDTLLAGHPPASGIEGVSFATGSLGHGLSLAAGAALASKIKGSNSRVFCLTSDGEWQEGSTWEALIFASHHRLRNLTVLVDHNGLQGFGSTRDVASMAPLWERLSGFDIELSVVDGHDHESLRRVMTETYSRTHVIVMQTIKGKGVSFMQDKMEWHYLPLSPELYALALSELADQ